MDNEKSSPPSMLGPTSRDADGKDVTDALGRRWNAVGKIAPKKIDLAEVGRQRRDADDLPLPGPDPRRLSREVLAEKLRPRRLVGGYEYRLEGPDFELADRILAMKEVPNTRAALGDGSGYGRLKFVIGPDDRQPVQNAAVFPGSAFAYWRRRTALPR